MKHLTAVILPLVLLLATTAMHSLPRTQVGATPVEHRDFIKSFVSVFAK